MPPTAQNDAHRELTALANEVESLDRDPSIPARRGATDIITLTILKSVHDPKPTL